MRGGSFHTQHPGGRSPENGLVVAGVGGDVTADGDRFPSGLLESSGARWR